MRWQTGAAVALLVALGAVAAVALTRDGVPSRVAASPTSPTEVVATASPSPSPSPSPSSSPSPELVLPDNDVDDPLEAIVAIEAYRDWLFANPDPDLVRFIYHANCGCVRPIRDALEELVERDAFIALDAPTLVSEVRVVRADTERDVVVEYSKTTSPLRMMTPSGEVLQRRNEEDTRWFRSALTLSEGGRWLVISIQELDA